MKFFRRLILVLVIFIILMVVISIFLPSKFELKRDILINADQEQVFKQVNELKNWKNWAPWALKDSSVYIETANYSSTSKGVGASFEWRSNNSEVGEGKMVILESIPNDFIKYSVDFGMGDVISEFIIADADEGVEVEWTMGVDFGFNPINKFFGLFMESYVAPDYELGLKRLKSFTENLPKIKSVKVEQKNIDIQWFLSIRDTVNQMEMSNVHGKLYASINRYMDENGVEISDSPIVIYHYWSDSIVDIEAGIPINDSLNVDDLNIKLNKLNAGNVVTAVHYGPYDRLQETYFGINEWMRKNKVVVIGPPWEKYLTDPTTEPNSEKWQTAVYFPIQ